MSNKIYTSDWFSHNIRNWKVCIDPVKPLDVLELGAFEGRSVVWMLENLNVKSLVAVDWWDRVWLESKGHFNTEQNFDHNVKDYPNVKKVMSTSYSFLRRNRDIYDLIYIDGDHMGKSVLTDAVMAHYVLRKGGYLIFDDYGQTTDPKRTDRPRGAIDAFFEQFGDEYKILHKDYQIIAKKKGEQHRR